MYLCFLNGHFYGSGSKAYMTELFSDYVENCNMYGKEEVTFNIVYADTPAAKKEMMKSKQHDSVIEHTLN